MIYLILAGVVVALVIAAISTYKVIEPNEAHVVTFMSFGRSVYSPRVMDGVKQKTAYFFIPLLMKRSVLPLTNVKMSIDGIHLNDKEVAPFICDVIAWININDPIMAAERLNLSNGDPFGSLKEDLINIVQSIARAVSMKQEILDILRDRSTFSKSVTAEVEPVLEKWGVDLVNLEVNDIRDDDKKDSNVIHDYESIRKVQVNSNARKQTAVMDREAIEIEQDNTRKSEIAKAEAEKAYRLAQINKEKTVGIGEQEKQQSISKAEEKTNEQQVLAEKALVVGTANVKKQATIEEATGFAEATKIKGEKEAEVTKLKGLAEGDAIKAKGLAEAAIKERMAEAMSKFNQASTNIEKIRAVIEIQKAMWDAYGKVASNAEIKIVNSGQGASLLGVPMNAETGANIGKMIEGLDMASFADGKLGKIEDLIDGVKSHLQSKKQSI